MGISMALTVIKFAFPSLRFGRDAETKSGRGKLTGVSPVPPFPFFSVLSFKSLACRIGCATVT